MALNAIIKMQKYLKKNTSARWMSLVVWLDQPQCD
jgi:hypothetical protein